jgi:hypothetical protein
MGSLFYLCQFYLIEAEVDLITLLHYYNAGGINT